MTRSRSRHYLKSNIRKPARLKDNVTIAQDENSPNSPKPPEPMTTLMALSSYIAYSPRSNTH